MLSVPVCDCDLRLYIVCVPSCSAYRNIMALLTQANGSRQSANACVVYQHRPIIKRRVRHVTDCSPAPTIRTFIGPVSLLLPAMAVSLGPSRGCIGDDRPCSSCMQFSGVFWSVGRPSFRFPLGVKWVFRGCSGASWGFQSFLGYHCISTARTFAHSSPCFVLTPLLGPLTPLVVGIAAAHKCRRGDVPQRLRLHMRRSGRRCGC